MELFVCVKTIGNKLLKGEGVIMRSGKVVVEWRGDIKTVVIYDSMDDFKKINMGCIVKEPSSNDD